MDQLIELAERGKLPDALIRLGIRRLLAQRIRAERRKLTGDLGAHLDGFVRSMGSGPVAVAQESANAQHYELPSEFFEIILGPAMKYSACLWSDSDDLESAENRMLQVTSERAGIGNGMDVLDLGCGWGSLSLWIARRIPSCRVLAVSNSKLQGEYIRSRCQAEGIPNVDVVTADAEAFEPGRRFDRVVSVEMFEHMRNWPELFDRVASWLRPSGAFFLHVFSHRDLAYFYEDRGPGDWMARHFFTGGVMPSSKLPFHLSANLDVAHHWFINGLNYSRTLESWLQSLDVRRDRVMPVLRSVYGDEAERWFGRWRMFFMACSELFKYNNGVEWGVSHFLLTPGASPPAVGVDRPERAAVSDPRARLAPHDRNQPTIG